MRCDGSFLTRSTPSGTLRSLHEYSVRTVVIDTMEVGTWPLFVYPRIVSFGSTVHVNVLNMSRRALMFHVAAPPRPRGTTTTTRDVK